MWMDYGQVVNNGFSRWSRYMSGSNADTADGECDDDEEDDEGYQLAGACNATQTASTDWLSNQHAAPKCVQ